MPRSCHLAAAALAAACLWTCAAPPKAAPGRPAAALGALDDPAAAAKRVTELADAYVDAYLKQFPENGTQALLPGFRHDRLTDNSLAAVRAWQTTEDGIAARLAEVRADGLWGRPEWVTYGFLREALESSRAVRVCRYELWPANQMAGWQASYATLADAQPVGTADFRAQALARWRGLPGFLDVEIANLREGLRQGYSTPKRDVELVIEQLDEILAAPVTASPFWSPAERDPDPAFRKAWEELIRDGIHPAAGRYRRFLKDEYLAKAREPLAVAANPDGDRCYAASLRAQTTLERPPRETFEMGMRALEDREKRMRELGQRIYGTTDLAAIRERLARELKNGFASREEALAHSRAVVEKARLALPGWFGLLPKATVAVEPLQAFQEKSGYSQYIGASEDGSRPGVYRINLSREEGQSPALAENTAFHEAYPGHHLQISIAQERAHSHPIARLISNSGFSEGWGRYSETLADEMGLYSSDLGRLALAARLPTGMVVDPGLHGTGWTRQQAMDFYRSKQTGVTEEAAGAYVDRISVLPGQMATYGVGEREIVELREQARRELGARFDIHEFHDRVLEDGSITLGMLRQKIERWIAEKKKG
jgi:uncharacterized protein (DUF885 family)